MRGLQPGRNAVVQTTLAIAIGGAAGALFRYWMSNGVNALLGQNSTHGTLALNAFPYGTLAVNILGSLLMGVLYVFFLERMTVGPEVRAAILIGVLGAFTTFSTFSIETFNLIEQANYMKAAMNMLISVLACVAAAWLGVAFGRQL
jgi:CrcB protein